MIAKGFATLIVGTPLLVIAGLLDLFKTLLRRRGVALILVGVTTLAITCAIWARQQDHVIRHYMLLNNTLVNPVPKEVGPPSDPSGGTSVVAGSYPGKEKTK